MKQDQKWLKNHSMLVINEGSTSHSMTGASWCIIMERKREYDGIQREGIYLRSCRGRAIMRELVTFVDQSNGGRKKRGRIVLLQSF